MTMENLTTRPDPKMVARIDPYSYVHKYEYHKDKNLSDITEFMLRRLFAFEPDRFFALSFDRIKEFDGLVIPFAQKLLKNSVEDYIFKYRLHKNKKLVSLLPSLWDKLTEWFGGKIEGSELKNKGALEKELFYIAEQISRHHPNYFVESGLAEDEEFGRFFEHIKTKARISVRDNLNKDGVENETQQVKKKKAKAQIKTSKLYDKNVNEVVRQLYQIAEELNYIGSKKAAHLVKNTIMNLIKQSHKRITTWSSEC